MGVFAAIDRVRSRENQLLRERIFAGEIICRCRRQSGSVADYVLTDLRDGGEIGGIVGYPRWTESGLHLFARLLGQSSPNALSKLASGQTLRVAWQIGADSSHVLEREVLTVTSVANRMSINWLSLFGWTTESRTTAPAVQSIQEVILGAVTGTWIVAEMAPAPPPLSRVAVRSDLEGRHYVSSADLPPFTRRYLSILHGLAPDAETIDATIWRSFMTQMGEGSR